MRPLRVAVCGSVDDGKSTLLGRLMHDAGSLFTDEEAAVRAASGAELNLAYFTDGLEHERKHGITLDVAWRHLELPGRRLLLGDAPGHAELLHNMATAASTADVAVLLVDAVRGVQSQTRRHLDIALGLGVAQVVIAVNKLDALGFDEAAFNEVRARFPEADAIPLSALRGDNVVRSSDRMPWYRGPSLAGWLTAARLRPVMNGTRAVVQLGSDDAGWAALHVTRGEVTAGQRLQAWPAGEWCEVVERRGLTRLSRRVRRGEVLADSPLRLAESARLTVVWLTEPLKEVRVLQHGRSTHAVFERSDALRFETPVWFDSGEPVLLIDSRGRTVGGARFA